MRERNPWLVLGAVAIGQLMVVVDVTVLNVALPEVRKGLGASMVGLEWAMISYSLVMIGLVPTFGRLSDVFGRKRLYLAGLCVFMAGSGLAAAASSVAFLIAARVVQGVGGALLMSNTMAIVTDTFPEGRRGAAMGAQSLLVSAGAALGPTIGGVLVTRYGWEAVFLVNLPVGVIGLVYAAIVVPDSRPVARGEPIDWVGAGLLLVGLTAALMAITRSTDWGWADARTWGGVALGGVGLALFVRRERRIEHPLVPLELFRSRAFSAGEAASMLGMFAMHSISFVIPFYWQAQRGFSAQDAGLLLLPLPVGLMITAPIAGRLSDKMGAHGVATAGLAIVAVALGLVAAIGADAPTWDVLWRFGLMGVGLGLFLPSNNNRVMSAVPEESRGVAGGLLALARFTGQSLGVALGGTAFVVATGGVAGNGLETTDVGAFMTGLRAVCFVALGGAALGALLSLQGVQPADRAEGARAQS